MVQDGPGGCPGLREMSVHGELLIRHAQAEGRGKTEVWVLKD